MNGNTSFVGPIYMHQKGKWNKIDHYFNIYFFACYFN